MNSILSYIFLIILFLSGCKEQEKNATTVQTPATHTDSYALIKSWGEYVRKGEYEILIDTAKTYYRKAIANHDKKTQAYVAHTSDKLIYFPAKQTPCSRILMQLFPM